MTTRPRRATTDDRLKEDRTRIRRLEALPPNRQAFIEFITLYQPVVALEQDGSSASGTLSTGEPIFDADAIQVTNIGGYAVNAPPVSLTGRALSFDSDASGVDPPSRFISLNEPGWYYVQRAWVILEGGGIPACWFNMTGDGNALGDGGGHFDFVRGTFNENASMRGHLMYLQDTETFPYLINTALAHECDVHDGQFTISVAFLADLENE